MPIRNTDIAEIFERMADDLEIEGENPFKIRAYRNAGRSIRGLGPELKEMVAGGEELTGLPGTAQALEKLKEKVAADVAEVAVAGSYRRCKETVGDIAIRRIGRQRGFKINERDPYEVDMAAVVHKAKERGCDLELNANLQRLDLTGACCRMAKEAGVLIAIDTDAHRTSEFGQLRYGIGQARRGWLEGQDVLNTRPLDELSKLLKRTIR